MPYGRLLTSACHAELQTCLDTLHETDQQ